MWGGGGGGIGGEVLGIKTPSERVLGIKQARKVLVPWGPAFIGGDNTHPLGRALDGAVEATPLSRWRIMEWSGLAASGHVSHVEE